MTVNWRHIKRTEVDSEAINSIGYDAKNRILQIEFTGGNVYNYFGVPLYIYEDLMKADSKGSFCNHHIRNEYDYELFIEHKKAG